MFQILFKKQIWESQIGFCFYSRTKPWWISKHCFTSFPIRNRVPFNHGKGQIVPFEPGQGWFLWKPFSRVCAMSCVWCVAVGKMGVRSSFSHSVVVKIAGLTQLLCTQDQFCTYSQNQIWVACVSNEVAICLDLLSWSQQCLISEESKWLPRCNSKFLSWWVAHESLFFSQVADVLAWKPFPRFMEVAEFGYFESMWWVSQMGEVLSASESSSRVSDLLLMLMDLLHGRAGWGWWSKRVWGGSAWGKLKILSYVITCEQTRGCVPWRRKAFCFARPDQPGVNDSVASLAPSRKTLWIALGNSFRPAAPTGIFRSVLKTYELPYVLAALSGVSAAPVVSLKGGIIVASNLLNPPTHLHCLKGASCCATGSI